MGLSISRKAVTRYSCVPVCLEVVKALLLRFAWLQTSVSEPIGEARVSPFSFRTWSPSWERVGREEKGEVLKTFSMCFRTCTHAHVLGTLASHAFAVPCHLWWAGKRVACSSGTGSSVNRAGMCFMACLAVFRESYWSWCFAPGLKNPIVKPRCLSRCLLILILSNSRAFGVVCRHGIFD